MWNTCLIPVCLEEERQPNMFGQIAVGFDQIQHVPDSDVVFDNRDTSLKALEIKQPDIALATKEAVIFSGIQTPVRCLECVLLILVASFSQGLTQGPLTSSYRSTLGIF